MLVISGVVWWVADRPEPPPTCIFITFAAHKTYPNMNSIFRLAFTLLLSVSTLVIIGQQQITNEGLWKDYTFYSKSVPGFNFLNDGKHYTRLQDNVIKKYDLVSGDFVDNLLIADDLKGNEDFGGKLGSYSYNADETMLMLKSETESIYRHSTKAVFHLYDISTGKLTKINKDDTKISYATLDPTSTKVAYVKENNLYVMDLEKGSTSQITTDGKKNSIINGATDWVYEEEFAFDKAFEWSSDGKRIAFIRFDESQVKEFTMTRYNGDLYPVYETFKYPKVGEKNAKVTAHVYNIKKKKTDEVDLGDMHDMYIPRIKWTEDKNKLCVFKMNRHQNDLKLYLYDAKKRKSSVMLHETNEYYIDITDNLTFLENGKEFVWTSEKSGYNHIYLYDMKGNEKKALTIGEYDVTAFYGVDMDDKKVYYQAAMDSPMEKQVYEVDMKSGKSRSLTPHAGTNRPQFSSTYDYFVNNNSTINTAPTYKVYDKKLRLVRVIEDNAGIADLQKDYGTTEAEFFSFENSAGVKLNGYMIKPADFDAGKQYPVFMTQYSGPGSQQVVDAWRGNNYWWYQMLAQHGYIVVCVDPRGTGARGEKFKKMTYMQLGHYETLDQIDAAKYVGSLPYTDADRIGIYGWSYGGYMSSLCILKGSDVFKAAIAVAPVTSWKWYDSVYTERYMRTLAENEAGYNDNSPVYFADELKGSYLLVHGIADDNVHFQNSAEMANALIKANKQFDTYYYPNRNHGIYGDNARLHLWNKMNDFIFSKI